MSAVNKKTEPKTLWEMRHNQLERELITDALSVTHNLEGAIRYLGISRGTMKSKMENLGIKANGRKR